MGYVDGPKCNINVLRRKAEVGLTQKKRRRHMAVETGNRGE